MATPRSGPWADPARLGDGESAAGLRVRVGVLGYGYWGPNLARNAAHGAGTDLVAIADLDPERLQRAAVRHPLATLSTDPRDLLADPEVDAVVVATPVATHYELVIEALERGKHVLVTKPLTASARQAEELVATAEKAGRALLVDHTFLFTGAVRKIREYIETGVLGSLYYYDSVRINLGLFQTDSNVVWDLAPHDISIMSYLIQERPVSVSAIGHSHVSEMENIAYITLRFDSGFLAHFHVNWLAPAKVRRTVVGGSARMLVYDDLEPSEKIRLYDSGVKVSASTDEIYQSLIEYRTGDILAPKLDQSEALAVEMEHFARVVQGSEEPVSDGRLGLEVVRIIEAAQASMRLGGVPVSIER